ncbi:MAG: N-acetylglucosamine-6-phosphate deacetylase [Clostridia bacterium]|nr:N-acetylglucosamine-6-phosphate deacetylase [Clostridia bacterium]
MAKIVYTNAWIYNTAARRFELGAMGVENGLICTPDGGAQTVDCGGAYIIPGLIDIHTHGRGGYESTEAGTEDFVKMAKSYAAAGTTSFLPTLMSVPLEMLEKSIDVTAEVKAMQDKAPCGANILGIHLEGRYINEKRKGAHNPKYLAPLNADEMVGLMTRAASLERFHLICAPELEGGEAFVKRAVSMGATVTIGHSDATYDECVAAMDWGVTSFTHLYNAMSPMTHRAPGCVGAGLSSDAYTELICDGCHVNPAVVRMTYRAKAKDKLVLVTDSAPAAGLPEGNYKMGGADIVIGNGAAFLPDGTLTGSIISMFDGVKNLAKFAGISLAEALPAATSNPARLIGADGVVGSLEIGKNADFILLKEDQAAIDRVYVRGTLVE